MFNISLVLLITLSSPNNRYKVNNKDKNSFNTYSSVDALNDNLKEK